MKRRQMREYAFMLVFEKIFVDYSVSEIIEIAKECQDEDFQIDESVENLFRGVIAHVDELDSYISEHLSNWRIDRINKVALAILRIALYEIVYEDETDAAIAINEAVEIAKKYTTSDDASFINGVLGSFVRKMDGTDENKSEELSEA